MEVTKKMFVGFIAVIVIILLVAAVFSMSSTGTGDGPKYQTEAAKALSLMSSIESESKFYYIPKQSFKGLDTNYFKEIEFKPNLLVESSNMTDSDWDGWPAELSSPYTGPYIKIGGTAGDDIRLIVLSSVDGTSAGIYMLKKKNSTVPEQYIRTLEAALAKSSSYIAG